MEGLVCNFRPLPRIFVFKSFDVSERSGVGYADFEARRECDWDREGLDIALSDLVGGILRRGRLRPIYIKLAKMLNLVIYYIYQVTKGFKG